jgi:hypothetical protein
VDDFVKQASEYAILGLSVIPVNHKVAVGKWRPYQQQIMAPDEIRRRFGSPEVTGVAIVFDGVSGDLAARDFDVADSYLSWKAKYPDEADRLPTVKTPRGFHVYFRQPGVRTKVLGDGELRGAGHYCLLPSSVYQGKVYQWINKIRSAADFLTINPSEVGLTIPWNSLTTTKNNQKETDRTESTTSVHSVHSVPSEERDKERETADQTSKTSIRSIKEAVAVAVPSNSGQNHQKLFLLARALRSLEKHKGSSLTKRERCAAFDLWYELAQRYLRPGQTRDEYLMEFLAAWNDARYALGERRVVSEAWTAASAAQPPAAARGELSDPRILLLVSFCRELQRRASHQPFYLSCRTVQELFSLGTHVTAHKWLQGLVQMDILEIVDRGTQGPGGRATRFRYLLGLDE